MDCEERQETSEQVHARIYISIPTSTKEGSTEKGGLVTIVPDTYMSEWSKSPAKPSDTHARLAKTAGIPSAGVLRSRAITKAEHPKRSSARSRSATMLARDA